MTETRTVVIIGGGVVGCAALYHLARRGMTDAVLLERQELTAGSSWHAAGNLSALTIPANAATLQKMTIEHYPELQEVSGQDCGLHIVGGVYLARNADQTNLLRRMEDQARRCDVPAWFITPQEAGEITPILNTEGLDSVLYEPGKGYCDPASVTQAYAKAARKMGAEIRRHTPVTATRQLPGGGWEVETPNGIIHCTYLVNAAGLWGREVAKLAGVDLPLMPVEHHYLVTEAIPEIAAMSAEIPHISEPSGGYYMRQEGQGVLLGIYEETCTLWAQDGTPMDFGHELLPDDLGRADKVIEHVMQTLPAVAAAGIKRVVNGPMILSPDLSPLVGPHPALRNYICATGVLSGFNQGGGIGRLVAEWVLDGEPSIDAHFWDVARFGDWADRDFAETRVRYGYENRQKVFFPLEEIPVARKRVTSAAYDRLCAEGAVHGAVFGMEHPLWYAPKGTEPRDVYGFHRGNWFEAVGQEARAIRQSVGLIDVTSFAKYRVRGAGAAAWLDHLLAGRVPAVDGKTTLAPMLSPKGKVTGDFTVSRLAQDDFLLLGSGVMQTAHMRWFRQMLPEDGVTVDNVSLDYGGLHLAGPQARALLGALTQDPVSNEAFPFLSVRCLEIAGIGEVKAVRVSFTGELGYELYVPRDQHVVLLDRLLSVGQAFGLRLCGGRAMGALRLEKGFGSWGGDLSPDYLPRECGMDRFIPAQKTGYIGEEAYRAQPQTPTQQFRQFVLEATTRDCFGGESIFQDGVFLGYVTSAGFGHHTGASIALGYVSASADASKPFTIGLLGETLTARMTTEPLYDPTGAAMRC